MKDQLKIILAAVVAFAGLMLFLMSYYGKRSAESRDQILEKARKAKAEKAKAEQAKQDIEDAEIIEETETSKEKDNGEK